MVQIGSRGITSGQAQYTRQQITAGELGAGVGVAAQNLGLSLAQYSQYKAQRDRQEEENNAALAWTRTSGEISRQMMELQRTAPEAAQGFTNQAHEFLRRETETFLSTIQDPKVREAYAARVESFVQEGTTQAFTFEFERGNTAFVRGTRDRLSEAQTRLYDDPDLFDQELGELEASIRGSTLTVPEQEALLDEVYSGLAGAAYQRQLEDSLDSFEPVGPTDGSDVTAAGLTGSQRGVLNAIAGVESPGYDVMYGGGRFSDYSDHPRQYITITSGPRAGEKSSAAGRYQFLASTWDEAVDELAAQGVVIPDFSPASQDRVALYIAQRTWRRYATSRGLNPDLDAYMASAGREELAAVRDALGGNRERGIMWEGVFKMSDDAFANAILGARGSYGGGTEGEYTPLPDAVNDPRYADLPFDTRMQMTQAAQTAHSQRLQAAAARQRDVEISTHNALAASFAAGEEGSYEAIQQALADGTIRDVSLQDDLRRRVVEYETTIANRQAIATGIAQGATFTSDNEDEVMDYYKTEGVLAGVQTGEAAALQTLIRDATATNYVPAPILDILTQQLSSPNPQQAQYAAEALSALYRANPTGFMQYATEDQVKLATTVASIMDTAPTPAEAADRIRYMTDPSTREERDRLREEGMAEIEDWGGLDGHITNLVDTWTGSEPSMPILPGQAARLRSQYADLYAEGYVRFGGDDSKAQAWADQNIRYNWGADPISGGLMEFAPTAAGANVQQIGGGYEWIEESVREQTGVGPDADIALISDGQTRAEFAQGLTPTYTVVSRIEDANGMEMFSVPMDESGRPLRVEMRPTEEQANQAEYDLELAQLNATIDRYARMDADAAQREFRSVTDGTWTPGQSLTPEQQRDLDRARRRRDFLEGNGPEVLREEPPAAPEPEIVTPPPLNEEAVDLASQIGVELGDNDQAIEIIRRVRTAEGEELRTALEELREVLTALPSSQRKQELMGRLNVMLRDM